MYKELWYDARDLKENEKGLIDAAIQRDYKVILMRETNKNIKFTNRAKRAILVEDKESLKNIPEKSIVVISKKELVEDVLALKRQDVEIGFFVNVIDKESMEEAAAVSATFDYVIVEFKDDTNIPLELILAKQQNKKVNVLKIVDSAQDGIVVMGVMESGSDGVILHSKNIEEISELALRRNDMSKKKLNLVEAEIIETKHLGMGERACVDTTSILDEGEGMLVGSTSTGGLLMCAEVYYLPYMNKRPFRVNAGAVHSYLWGPNNVVEYLSDLRAGSKVLAVTTDGTAREVNVGRIKTEVRPLLRVNAGAVHSYLWGPNNVVEYLSDLRAGSKVLAVTTDGTAREVNVGRIKTEVRPLLLIKAKVADEEINVIVQDDWHIRLYGADKSVLHVTELKKGTKVLAYVCEPGRHVGVKIDETITER